MHFNFVYYLMHGCINPSIRVPYGYPMDLRPLPLTLSMEASIKDLSCDL